MKLRCPVCQRTEVPPYRPLCGRCYDTMPKKELLQFVVRWRRRVQDPIAYQESLAGLRKFRMDTMADRNEEK